MKKIVFILLLLFILTIPIEDMLSVNSNLSMTRRLGQIVIAAWGLQVLMTQKVHRIHPFFIAAVLFIAWNWISYLWTIDLDLTELRTKTYIQLGIMSVMLWDLVDTRDKLRAVIQTFIFGSFISVGSTIVNFLNGTEAYLYSGGRYVATGFNANDLAILVALGIPLAWYMIISSNSHSKFRWFRIINILYLPLAYFAIMLTGSRAGFLVALVSLVYIALTIRRLGRKGRISFAILVTALVIVAINLVPDATLARVLSTFSFQDSSDLGGRIAIYAAAARVIDQHPLLGIGCGAFKSATGLNIIAHNSFLSVLSETGIVGFFFFTLMLLICGLEALRQPKLEALLWLAVLFIWGLGGSSVSWDFRKPTWFFLTMIVISAELFSEKKECPQMAAAAQRIVRLNPINQGISNLAGTFRKT